MRDVGCCVKERRIFRKQEVTTESRRQLDCACTHSANLHQGPSLYQKRSEIRIRISGLIRIRIRMSAGSLKNFVDSLSCRRQSFRRVSWRSVGDCTRNANTSPKNLLFRNGEGSGKVMRNPYQRSEHHQKLTSSSGW